MRHNLSAQFVYLSPRVQDYNEKRLYWASVVRGSYLNQTLSFLSKVRLSRTTNSGITINTYTQAQNVWSGWPVYEVKCQKAGMIEGEFPLPPALQYLSCMI